MTTLPRLHLRLPVGVTAPVLTLRVALLVLPLGALAMALPVRPHVLVVLLVLACSAWWAHTPDHPTGAVALAVVAVWWTIHGVVDWRILVVAALLLLAHVAATLLSYGPATLALDRALATLWVRRGLLTLVPLPLTYAAVTGLDAELAPSWLWMSAALVTVALLLVAARLTQPGSESWMSVASGDDPL